MKISPEQLHPVTDQLCQAGRYLQAVAVLSEFARKGITDFGALNTVVNLALRNQDIPAAKALVDRIVKGWPKDPRSWDLRYKVLHAGSQWREALIVLKKVARYSAEATPEYYLAKAEVLERLFKPDQSLECLEKIPQQISVEAHSRYWYLKASILLQCREYQRVVDELLPWLDNAPSDRFVAGCWKFIAKAQDALGDYDGAFQSMTAGNTLQASLENRPISENSLRRRVEVFRSLFTQEWMGEWVSPDVVENPPVFLIGFPRSGTTLLEQVLDAHPGIQAMEEPPTIGTVLRQAVAWMNASAQKHGALRGLQGWKQQWMASFDCLRSLSDTQVKELRQTYYTIVNEQLRHDKSKLLLDKMPLNTVDIGLILKLFPDAKFVVALRHPCDCVLSSYMQSFQMNDAMANFLDLDSAASFYRNVMALLDQYQQVFDLQGRVCTVRYEDLIHNFNGEAGRLLDFLGLDWDDAVTRYDEHAKARGTLATPSYQGVTQKIYSTSKERWRHYAKWMEPVLPHFREAAERYGYDLTIPPADAL